MATVSSFITAAKPRVAAISIIVLHLSIFAIAVGMTWHYTHSHAQLQHHGAPGQAYVVGKDKTSGRTTSYFLRYRFVRAGTTMAYTKLEGVEESDFDRINVGDRLPFIYDVNNPLNVDLNLHGELQGKNYLVVFLALSTVWFFMLTFSLIIFLTASIRSPNAKAD